MGLFEHKIKQFPDVIDWVKGLDVALLSEYLTSGRPKLFMGSGGSFSACAFGELLSADRGVMAHALTPYFYIKSGFGSVDADALLISASGGNLDIVRAFDKAYANPQSDVAAITLQSEGMLQKRFSDIPTGRLFCYDMNTGHEGFLSTTSVVAFYALLYRAYGYKDLDQLSTAISETERQEILNFVEALKRISLDEMTQHEAYLHKLEGVDSFFILYSPSGYPAALDIESKFSEGALGNTQLADYRNFAHGRFNWFTQRPGQTGLICIQTPDDIEQSEDVISRVPSFVPSLRVRTELKFPLGAINLLIKEHYLCSALGERWGLDISNPEVPDYGRELHSK